MNVVEDFQISDQIRGRARLIQSWKKHEKLQFHTEERKISLLVLNVTWSKLQQIRKIFLVVGADEQWNTLLTEAMKSPPLEIYGDTYVTT